ncbi:MAG: DUF983 domain-containing protein [Acidimicrobiia bacterium]|nr:MAG: DUF983 domain-containing protein [Acidimicrobiia bacterium]
MLRRFSWAVTLRCPDCGTPATRRFRLVESCQHCRLRFERHEGYWVGAVAVNTLVTIAFFITFLVGSMVLTWPDPPWGAITIAAVIVNLVLPIAFYPWSKTIWVAFDLALHPPQPEDRV